MPQANTWSVTDDLRINIIMGENISHIKKVERSETYFVRLHLTNGDELDLLYGVEADRDSVYDQLKMEIGPKDIAP